MTSGQVLILRSKTGNWTSYHMPQGPPITTNSGTMRTNVCQIHEWSSVTLFGSGGIMRIRVVNVSSGLTAWQGLRNQQFLAQLLVSLQKITDLQRVSFFLEAEQISVTLESSSLLLQLNSQAIYRSSGDLFQKPSRSVLTSSNKGYVNSGSISFLIH